MEGVEEESVIRVVLELSAQKVPIVGDGRFMVREFPEADDWFVDGAMLTLVSRRFGNPETRWKQVVSFRAEDVARVERGDESRTEVDPRCYATVSGPPFDGVPPQE